MAFQIWMVIDCIQRRENFFWIAIIILFGPIGALVYLFVVRLAGVKVQANFKIGPKISATDEIGRAHV